MPLVTGTFACEIQAGDVLLSRQTFTLASVGNFSPYEVTLDCDYEVVRSPQPIAGALPEAVEIVARPRGSRTGLVALVASRGRIIRTIF